MILLPSTVIMIKILATIHNEDEMANAMGREGELTAGDCGQSDQWNENEGTVILVQSGFGTRSGHGGPVYDAQQHLQSGQHHLQ